MKSDQWIFSIICVLHSQVISYVAGENFSNRMSYICKHFDID
jgi:hypothetical protein